MPNTEIKLPNLTPGKRYRMVVSTNADVNGLNIASNTTSAPSLEFVVPTSPRLISTYTPTCKTVTQLHDTTSQAYTPVVAGTYHAVGSVSAASTTTIAMSNFLNTANLTKNYRFTVAAGSAKPPIGAVCTVSGVSTGAAPFYFDWLNYTVTSTTSTYIYATGSLSATATGNTAFMKQKDSTVPGTLWATRAGAGWGDNRSYANMKVSWSNPPVPAVAYTDPATGGTPYIKTNVGGGTYYHVDVAAPLDLKDQLVWTNTVRDIVYFFYIDNGIYYDFGPVDEVDRSFVDGSNAIVNATTLSPLSLDNSVFTTGIYKNGPIFTARDTKVNDVTTGAAAPAITRSYRFSVARYVFDGTTTWRGRWLQTDSTFAANPTLSKIIISQPGVMTI